MSEPKDRFGEALEILEDVLHQSCYVRDASPEGYYIDSMALSAYAGALRFLAEHGRFKIESEGGRRVIGKWIPREKEEP